MVLGYTLDVWQYRLVMQVFQSVGMKQAKSTSFAIRQPGSNMEALAWRRLGIDIIQMEPNEFAEKVLDDLARQKENMTYGR
jgi:4'-phosphopantetheinyl transferase EntD